MNPWGLGQHRSWKAKVSHTPLPWGIHCSLAPLGCCQELVTSFAGMCLGWIYIQAWSYSWAKACLTYFLGIAPSFLILCPTDSSCFRCPKANFFLMNWEGPCTLTRPRSLYPGWEAGPKQIADSHPCCLSEFLFPQVWYMLVVRGKYIWPVLAWSEREVFQTYKVLGYIYSFSYSCWSAIYLEHNILCPIGWDMTVVIQDIGSILKFPLHHLAFTFPSLSEATTIMLSVIIYYLKLF